MTDNRFKQIFPFTTPRKLQRKLIEKIIEYYEEGYEHIVINAPTGIGKSVVAMAVANYFLDVPVFESDKSAYILTSQKMLQDQYVKDFTLPTVKGRNNYPCTYLGKGATADMGSCIKNKWKRSKRENECPNCPYYKARIETYGSPISVLNYAYFLNMGSEAPEIQTIRKLLILDECHNVEQLLLNHSSVIIDRFECKKFNLYDSILNFPKEYESEEAKFHWLFTNVFPQLIEQARREESALDGMYGDDPNYMSTFKKFKYLKDLNCKIANIKEEYEEGRHCAVIQNENKMITFKPIFGKSLATKYLLPFGTRTLSMSATVLSKEQYCRDMGFEKDNTVFIKLPSLFPVENRKVYSLGIGSMSYKCKHETMPKIAHAVELLLKKHQNERGIIHTVNYEVAEYLMQELNDPRLIMPRGKSRDAEIQMFLNSKSEDKVLISPSLTEGIDLKDDLSRFTIVCKVPYASLADDWVKKRMDLSPKWYTENTIMNLVQMTGRSVRTETDYATAYILDSDFQWFFKRNLGKFPDWWKKSVINKV